MDISIIDQADIILDIKADIMQIMDILVVNIVIKNDNKWL